MEKIGKEAHDGLPKRQGSCTCLSELGDKWELASGQNTSRGEKKVLGGIIPLLLYPLTSDLVGACHPHQWVRYLWGPW